MFGFFMIKFHISLIVLDPRDFYNGEFFPHFDKFANKSSPIADFPSLQNLLGRFPHHVKFALSLSWKQI